MPYILTQKKAPFQFISVYSFHRCWVPFPILSKDAILNLRLFLILPFIPRYLNIDHYLNSLTLHTAYFSGLSTFSFTSLLWIPHQTFSVIGHSKSPSSSSPLFRSFNRLPLFSYISIIYSTLLLATGFLRQSLSNSVCKVLSTWSKSVLSVNSSSWLQNHFISTTESLCSTAWWSWFCLHQTHILFHHTVSIKPLLSIGFSSTPNASLSHMPLPPRPLAPLFLLDSLFQWWFGRSSSFHL